MDCIKNQTEVARDNPCIELIVEALAKEENIRLLFSGASMLPTLTDGMQVVVEKVPPAQVRLGNLILYRKAEQMIIHRAVGILHQNSEIVFISRGDHQGYLGGERVSESSLLGVIRKAFSPHCPNRDMLYMDKTAGYLYVMMNTLIVMGRKLEEISPPFIRPAVRFGLRGFFFILSKVIQLIYLGVRNGLFLFRRTGYASTRSI